MKEAINESLSAWKFLFSISDIFYRLGVKNVFDSICYITPLSIWAYLGQHWTRFRIKWSM